jgi:hypothetical protein
LGAFAILTALETELNRFRGRQDWALRKESALTDCLAALHKKFARGEASPHDVDENQENILHVSYLFLDYNAGRTQLFWMPLSSK